VKHAEVVRYIGVLRRVMESPAFFSDIRLVSCILTAVPGSGTGSNGSHNLTTQHKSTRDPCFASGIRWRVGVHRRPSPVRLVFVVAHLPSRYRGRMQTLEPKALSFPFIHPM